KPPLGIPKLSKSHGFDGLDRLGAGPFLRVNSSRTCCTENRRQQNPLRFHGTPTPSSHKHTLNDACFLIQLSMECNREERRLLLTAKRLSGCRILQRRRDNRRNGRRNARGLRAQAQLLKD